MPAILAIQRPARPKPTKKVRPPLGPTRLMASGRLARRVATNRSDKGVYIDGTGHAVCEHGERWPSIAAWRVREQEDPSFVRPSLCDCENIDGLKTQYGVPPEEWPVHDERLSLYELLGSLGAEEAKVRGRPQRLAFRTARAATWVQPSGALVCCHGNSRRVLGALRKGGTCRAKVTTPCACVVSVPRREGSVFAPRGGCVVACAKAQEDEVVVEADPAPSPLEGRA